MKARIGFVLFMFAFVIMAVIVPVIARILRFLQGMLQSFSIAGERCIRGARFVTKKISMAEWKNFTQKAS